MSKFFESLLPTFCALDACRLVVSAIAAAGVQLTLCILLVGSIACGRTYLDPPANYDDYSQAGRPAGSAGSSGGARSGPVTVEAGGAAGSSSGLSTSIRSGGSPAMGGQSAPVGGLRQGGVTAAMGGWSGAAAGAGAISAGGQTGASSGISDGFAMAQPGYGLTDILPLYKTSSSCVASVQKYCPAAIVCSMRISDHREREDRAVVNG